MNIQEHIPLAPYTTFRIGGNARYFCVVTSRAELHEVLIFAREQKLPLFILGGGSNMLISDDGFPGLVVKMEIRGITYCKEDTTTLVEVGAGVSWDLLVADTVSHGLSGIENLSLIPGTVGAAPVQNIGAYGVEIKDTLVSVVAVHQETGEEKVFLNVECDFNYRHSFFKTPQGKPWIIVSVSLRLTHNAVPNISYKDLRTFFGEVGSVSPSIQEVRDAVIAIRTKKLPDVTKIGTAGSFFKNPIISISKYEELKKTYPEMPSFSAEDGKMKIPAAWLLDKVCGFKGMREGALGTYENQALVLVNHGGATALEVKILAQKMQKAVEEKTGIFLEPEVVHL